MNQHHKTVAKNIFGLPTVQTVSKVQFKQNDQLRKKLERVKKERIEMQKNNSLGASPYIKK